MGAGGQAAEEQAGRAGQHRVVLAVHPGHGQGGGAVEHRDAGLGIVEDDQGEVGADLHPAWGFGGHVIGAGEVKGVAGQGRQGDDNAGRGGDLGAEEAAGGTRLLLLGERGRDRHLHALRQVDGQ